MADAAADKDNTAGNDISTDDTARDGCEEGSEQSVNKKIIPE